MRRGLRGGILVSANDLAVVVVQKELELMALGKEQREGRVRWVGMIVLDADSILILV